MSVKIDWTAVLAFIAARDAEVATSCSGVARSEIDAIEKQYGFTLPENYVNFLQVMGESSGGLFLFGFTRVHQFSRLIRRLPSTRYPMQSFFKVAIEADVMSPAREDVYLDLKRSDGLDGPLVRFELPLGRESEIEEDPLSVTERIIYELVWELDVSRMPFGAKVLVFDAGVSRNQQNTKEDATEVLGTVGFSASLPELSRVAALAQPGMSALISISEELVTFELGGDSRDAIDVPVRALLAGVAGAVLQEPPAPRTESGS